MVEKTLKLISNLGNGWKTTETSADQALQLNAIGEASDCHVWTIPSHPGGNLTSIHTHILD